LGGQNGCDYELGGFLKEQGVVKRYIVTPDKHFPHADNHAIQTLCKAIEILQPDGYIDLGDTGEWSGASHWRWKKRAKPTLEWYLPEIITDVENVNAGMDIIDEALDKANVKEKHFCEGNHEVWMNDFVETYPYLKEYKIIDCLKLAERGYNFHPAGKLLHIGDLAYYHGHLYGGMHHVANHLRRFKRSIVYGHFHDIQVYSDTSHQGTILGYSIGCLKKLGFEDNKFTKGRPLNWSHAFAIVDYLGSKNFFVHVVEIKHGKAIINGRVIG